MNDHSAFRYRTASPAGLWQRTAGVPGSGIRGRPARPHAVLNGPSGATKRPTSPLWRRGRKAGDVPVLHPVDKWDRFIWVRPDPVAQLPESPRAKRRRTQLAGRNLVSEPVNAAWITSRHGPDVAHRFGTGWALHQVESEPLPSSWHRAPVSQDGRGPGQLARRPPVRRKVITPTLD